MPDDNLPQNQNPTGEELENSAARVVELEGLIAKKDEELADKDSRISELEQVVADRDNRIVTFKQSVAELDQKVTDLDDGLSQAVSSYRALVVKANPAVPEELIVSDSIEAIDKSVEDAQTLINKVREGLEAEIASAKVPAGAPQRTPVDLSALSPREKIQYAIGERR
ncbi:MAG: hypothetical protein OEZ00_01355 [Dehalococcoidia bacterium]|nr:hypothetical protein [Dehalococcoidia bacterium]